MGVQFSKREKIYYSLIGSIGFVLLIIETVINKNILLEHCLAILFFLLLAIITNKLYIKAKRFIIKFEMVYAIISYFTLNFICALWIFVSLIAIESIISCKREKLLMLNDIGNFIIVFTVAHHANLYVTSLIGINNEKILLIDIILLLFFMLIFTCIMYLMQFNIAYKININDDFKDNDNYFLLILYIFLNSCANFYLYSKLQYIGLVLGLGIVIVTSHLTKSLQQLKKYNRDLIVVSEIAAAMASKLNLTDTLINIINGVCKSLDCDFCAIFEYDKNHNKLNLIEYNMSKRFVLMKAKEIEKVINDNIQSIIDKKKSIIIKDISKNKIIKYSNINVFARFKSIIYEPLILENKYLGCIIIARKERNFFYKEQLKIADLLTNHAVIAYKNAKMFKKVKNESIRDSLTGLYNQKQFFTALENIDNNNQSNITSLIIFDIDKFKKINDNYGHQTGDKIIREISYIISSSIRKQDTVFRYGGEEFTVVLPKINQNEALKIGERIRYKISKQAFYSYDGRRIDVTISGGVSEFPNIADSSTKLLSYADRALYNGAKQKGRNKISIYS